MTDLTELLARVEKAEGPDRELDKALWYKLIFDPALDDPDELHWLKFVGQKPAWFTASLDAALALVERVLPGTLVLLKQVEDGQARLWWAKIETQEYDLLGHAGRFSTPALALLAALLKALSAQQQGD